MTTTGALLLTPLPTIAAQLERLVALGLPDLAGLSGSHFRALAEPLVTAADDTPCEAPANDGALLAVHPSLVPASALAPLMSREDKPGFVVVDLTDLDEFAPIDGFDLPDAPLYLARDIDRGDDLANWSPDEALPELTARGRRPLTISEGISWLLQQPERLEPGRCFMTIGSRKRAGRGLDSRTPAIWISGGTGRDGRERRGAPKVGWCWAGNRHIWLGFASAR